MLIASKMENARFVPMLASGTRSLEFAVIVELDLVLVGERFAAEVAQRKKTRVGCYRKFAVIVE